MTRRIAYVLATWFGCGRVPVAPGTAGTLGAIPLYLLIRPLGPMVVLGTALLLAAVGVWASGHVIAKTGEKDPQVIVIDEVVGVLVTLSASSPTWTSVVVGFILFRIFDQWKPWPARSLEGLQGGWGVVMDDVAAGAWGAAVLGTMRVWGLS
jgi:phosphatidylglycerophosphatase A